MLLLCELMLDELCCCGNTLQMLLGGGRHLQHLSYLSLLALNLHLTER